MTYDRFVIAYTTENSDLYTMQFDSEDEARNWLDESDQKAVLIKIKNICGAMLVPTTIEIEDHT